MTRAEGLVSGAVAAGAAVVAAGAWACGAWLAGKAQPAMARASATSVKQRPAPAAAAMPARMTPGPTLGELGRSPALPSAPSRSPHHRAQQPERTCCARTTTPGRRHNARHLQHPEGTAACHCLRSIGTEVRQAGRSHSPRSFPRAATDSRSGRRPGQSVSEDLLAMPVEVLAGPVATR